MAINSKINMDLIKIIESLEDKQDFVDFVEILIIDMKENPDEWENNSLISFLEAIASWVMDMEGYYVNNNIPMPKDINWKVFANILAAARVYE